jgi:hypothetical protein
MVSDLRLPGREHLSVHDRRMAGAGDRWLSRVTV